MSRLFCFGLGYVATHLARRLIAQGWQVGGTTRSPEKAAVLRAEGINAVFDDSIAGLEHATHLLCSAAPDEAGDPILSRWGDTIRKQRGLVWVGYLSATSVYGDHQGAWVDETAALNPTSPRGTRRIAAEQAWLDLGKAFDVPAQIFRLAGIYGPGRNALTTVQSGRAQRIVKPGLVFSRIHAEDIATVLEASIARPNQGAIYNVADDEPAAPDEVITEACALLGVTPPPLINLDDAVLSPMGREFYADAKRIANRRIKAELGVTLAYPTYREGLRSLMSLQAP